MHAAFLCCSLLVLAAMATGALAWWWLPVPLVAAPLNGAGCWRMIHRLRGRP